jgi:hypothetical protein
VLFIWGCCDAITLVFAVYLLVYGTVTLTDGSTYEVGGAIWGYCEVHLCSLYSAHANLTIDNATLHSASIKLILNLHDQRTPFHTRAVVCMKAA